MRIKRDKDYRGKNNYKMLIKIILLNYKWTIHFYVKKQVYQMIYIEMLYKIYYL